MKHLLLIVFSLTLLTSCDTSKEPQNYIEIAFQEQLNHVPDKTEYTRTNLKDVEIVFYINSKLYALIFKDKEFFAMKELNFVDSIDDDGIAWLYSEELELDLNLLMVYIREDIELPILVNGELVDGEKLDLNTHKAIYQIYDKPLQFPIIVEAKKN
ncbi:hypothetical protein ACFYKX_03630 [Cytobacillus sp. FJAT-54145]|uniref:Lipoprotein n=1 Tax=Cytobacillus spartinae TaxID=3299023 RepID=A0ABW6K7Z3_9BACI